MAIEFKTPTQVAEEYLDHLKGLKPEINRKQTDSDWWIRSRVVGGVAAGLYGDQKKLANDPFPQSARRNALERHLNTYFGSGFLDATKANGSVLVSGATGSSAAAGEIEFVFEENGNTYVNTHDVTLAAPTGIVEVQSIAAGQDQNLLEGAVLSLSSPPAGFDPTATVVNGNISDGRDAESEEEAASRILTRLRRPPAGGTRADYERWAKEASASVVSANVIRYRYGLGTVAVIITAGTTNIDQAINTGQAIVLIPSPELVAIVQAYVDAVNPETDLIVVSGATEKIVPVTVRVTYVSGDGDTVVTLDDGSEVTQSELVQREVSRGIYKTPPGGRKRVGGGFVVCSEIEQAIDKGLSADPDNLGLLQILSDRQVDDLSLTSPNLLLKGTEVAVPGVITVEVLT